ncbi:MAG: hypothetical protein QXM37_05760, partial [Candidatus Bathyarchaeia archaeon]
MLQKFKIPIKFRASNLKIPLSKKNATAEEDAWPFKRDICKTLEEAVKEHPYLAAYLDGLEEKPKYVVSPDLEEKSTNILYPIGLGIYIHIDAGGEIGRYNIIEPKKPP